MMRRAIFLDRDGVLNPLIWQKWLPGKVMESPLCPEQFELFPWVPQAVKIFNGLGFRVFVITNQPAIAKGKLVECDLRIMHDYLLESVRGAGGYIAKIYTCLHHPDPKQVVRSDLLANCDCRKPRPGMLILAAEEFRIDLTQSWMVGDSWKDIEAGQAVRCRTILIRNDIDNRGKNINADFEAENLLEAAHIIEREELQR